MLKSITIKPKTVLSKILFFKKIGLNQKVNLLFGGNGVGKTTLIEAILQRKYKNEFISDVTDKKTLVFEYTNSKQNARELHKNPYMKYNDFFDPAIINRMFDAQELSEGQSIIYTIQEFLYCAKENDNDKDYLFIMDEVDSGLSIDNIEWLCNEIKEIINNRDNIQFIIAFNNYEFCNQFNGNVIDMYAGKAIIISNYEEYKKLLKDNREKLLKKRKYNQFQKFIK